MPDHPHTIATIKTRGVVVPMARPLATGAGAITTVPFMLVDLETRGYRESTLKDLYDAVRRRIAERGIRRVAGETGVDVEWGIEGERELVVPENGVQHVADTGHFRVDTPPEALGTAPRAK